LCGLSTISISSEDDRERVAGTDGRTDFGCRAGKRRRGVEGDAQLGSTLPRASKAGETHLVLLDEDLFVRESLGRSPRAAALGRTVAREVDDERRGAVAANSSSARQLVRVARGRLALPAGEDRA
jgi:hypothetical protein